MNGNQHENHPGTEHWLSFLTREDAGEPLAGTTGNQQISSTRFPRRTVGAGDREPLLAEIDLAELLTITPATRPQPVDDEKSWAKWEAEGRRTGHVRCRCPVCQFDVMVAVFDAVTAEGKPKSGGGWPACLNCSTKRSTPRSEVPRVAPIGGLAALDHVRRLRPGLARNARQLKADGCSIADREVAQ